MSLSVRLSSCLTILGLTLAIAAYPAKGAWAQVPAPSVQTYVEGVQPDTTGEGIYPEGMTWGQPLKAGDMVLPRLTKPKDKTKTTTKKAAINGSLNAPQIPVSTKAAAPQIAKGTSSDGSMLLQGMKNVLQKSGQIVDAPKSDLQAIDPTMVTIDDSVLATTTGTPATGAAQTMATQALAAPIAKEGFVAGQEPKGWVSPDKAAQLKQGSDGMMDIVFPPEMAQPVAAQSTDTAPAVAAMPDESPKATDMMDAPKPLEQATVKPSAEPSGEKSLFDRMADPFTSIFGEPVDEEAEAKTVASKKDTSVATKSESKTESKSDMPLAVPCEPAVTKWTRECGDAGYPAHFVGQIIGETRISCPSGDARDVWLSNSCAAPIASSDKAIQAPNAMQMDKEPAPLTESDTTSVVVPETDGAVDASCGVANGLAAEGKPAGDLCHQGQPTPVQGEGPWRWSCKGFKGGVTVSCAAPLAAGAKPKKAESKDTAPDPASLAVEDGKCGAAIEGGTDSEPVSGLCAKGMPSRVNGSGPWTWACSGRNGGTAASCTANRKTDGTCGTAHNEGADSMPMRDLCAAGYASAVTGQGPWNWTCSGLHGGSAITCIAPLKNNAVCGAASTRGHNTMPSDNLCHVGKASSVSGDGPWSWTCAGDNGGASVSCKASPLVDGTCGPAHGNRYEKAPTTGLCAAGRASRVSGLGPFNWSCAGDNGGATVSCTAALGTKEEVESVVSCGAASEALAFAKPSDKLCAGGTASDVSGDGPWTWSCADDAGHNVSCSTLTASSGKCGVADGVATGSEPKTKLCESGAPSDVRMVAKKEWKWDCQGAMGGSAVSCSAPIKAGAEASPFPAPKIKPETPAAPEAICGSASGQSLKDKPSSDLCAAGKASAIRGSGPWLWTCAMAKAKVNCEAQKTLDGLCGTANGSVQKQAPTAALCASGSPTPVSGSGPWNWSCIGTGSGSSESCSAAAQSQTKVDGTCGASANAIMNQAPNANLCDSGMPSTVYGEGPWTWTCSGMNGGIASTCTTSKILPKAPPPPGPMVNGLCGGSNGVAAEAAPSDDLCAAGVATALSGNGPWNWSCLGANGGMTVSCTAPLIPPAPIEGMCGGANGVSTLAPPKGGLCAAGIASAVSGKGPWTWSCSGTNGGGAVSCVAPMAGKGATTGVPSMVTPSQGDEAPPPKAAPLGLVTPQLQTKNLPAMKAGTVPNLKASNKPALKELSVDTKTDDEKRAEMGLVPPVLDSSGKAVPGTRLMLDPDVSTISFARGSDKLDKDGVEIVEKLTRMMLANKDARISLVAYSDTDGSITPRDARRISLNRALAIRDFMSGKGVPASRVDVRPMGANVPSGDMDRVDIKVN